MLHHDSPPTTTLADAGSLIEEIGLLLRQLNRVIVGKEEIVRLSVTALLARGHLLLEDVPGVGKTTLSHALAKSIGLEFRRIQFTSDLLPADVIGNSIFDAASRSFVFHRGPIFAGAVLIDEINRATPKTQSALLEAMEEGRVSIDGVGYDLPDPFFVVATQNPQQLGTFALPESQLDRFLMRLHLGFPDRESERRMLLGEDRSILLRTLEPVMSGERLRELQAVARSVRVSDAVIAYLQALLAASRERHPVGLSPRAGIAFLRAAKAWALLEGRDYLLPDDLQAVGLAVMAHRLGNGGETGGNLHGGRWHDAGERLALELLEEVAV
ncbi:MAG TPA: MoxR family ATPase [Chthoniobacteraceae bacterium]|nr:MoxR family ATPase [Chthoniobacteraceae bacterium]